MTTVSQFIDAGRGPIVQVQGDVSVAQVVALLAERRIGCVPVVEGERVIGIFSERDLVYGTAREGGGLLDRPVSEVMTSPAVTITAETPILSALSLMTKRRLRHLPIVEGERMIGFVSIGDLVKSRIDRVEAEVEAMRAYIQTA